MFWFYQIFVVVILFLLLNNCHTDTTKLSFLFHHFVFYTKRNPIRRKNFDFIQIFIILLLFFIMISNHWWDIGLYYFTVLMQIYSISGIYRNFCIWFVSHEMTSIQYSLSLFFNTVPCHSHLIEDRKLKMYNIENSEIYRKLCQKERC